MFLLSVWIINLFIQDQREDQSLSSLIYYNESLSDVQESHPQLL